MSEVTREQAYRRWKKGEDPHKLAKEMGTTRERMRRILEKLDTSVPLVDRIEELEAQLAEQIEWVKRLADDLIASEAKLAKAVEALEWCATVHGSSRARNTLAELKGQDDE